MKALLSVRSLKKSYVDGDQIRQVLNQMTFDVGPGEVLALMGPSGSGKSTLLNLLAGLSAVDSGTISLDTGETLTQFERMDEKALTRLRRRHIGYVFQFFNLVPTLTVRENVLLPLELNGLEHLTVEALERLEKLGLSDRLHDFPAHLSGGERQRTAIARAMAHRPCLVLADEPTGNLDASTAETVATLLAEEVRASNSCLVVATHSKAIGQQADQLIELGQ